MKTDYRGHDAGYIARKAKGFPGWADAETLQRNLATLEQEFAAVTAANYQRTLELGCGAGDIAIWLKRRGFKVAGVDCAPTAIDWARQKAADLQLDIDFRLGSVLDLASFDDATVDLVVDGHCLHCIIGEDRSKLLSNVCRVLRPAGRLFVKSMCGDLNASHLNLSTKLLEQFDPETRCSVNSQGIVTRYLGMADTILDEVTDAGFEIETHRINPSLGAPDSMDELLLWAVKPS